MLDNKAIVERVRKFGRMVGMRSDSAICEKCGIGNRMALKNVQATKTSPRLVTLDKFSRGLGVQIEDLIYDRSDADMEISRRLNQLSDYEKTKIVVYIDMMIAEKNALEQRKAA